VGRNNFLQGTIELAILGILRKKQSYGWEISKILRSVESGTLSPSKGTLYPILQLMLDRGWVRARMVRVGEKRQRRYFHLTKRGADIYAEKGRNWKILVKAVGAIVRGKIKIWESAPP
jgi:PadR family transcriptional regulator, regulatory protein PadR